MKQIFKPQFFSLAFLYLVLSGCASNEALFAQYDALCHQGVCVAPVQNEVIYREEEPGLVWESAVYFGFDIDYLNDSEKERLERNISILESYPDLKVSLQAFADAENSVQYNMALANRRRQHVLDALLERGVDRDRILGGPAGELLPVLPNDSVQNRILNRRVEMMLMDQRGVPLPLEVKPTSKPREFNPPAPLDRVPK